jgi:hypothetical protein
MSHLFLFLCLFSNLFRVSSRITWCLCYNDWKVRWCVKRNVNTILDTKEKQIFSGVNDNIQEDQSNSRSKSVERTFTFNINT